MAASLATLVVLIAGSYAWRARLMGGLGFLVDSPPTVGLFYGPNARVSLPDQESNP
jgi:hypothetical protein